MIESVRLTLIVIVKALTAAIVITVMTAAILAEM